MKILWFVLIEPPDVWGIMLLKADCLNQKRYLTAEANTLRVFMNYLYMPGTNLIKVFCSTQEISCCL